MNLEKLKTNREFKPGKKITWSRSYLDDCNAVEWTIRFNTNGCTFMFSEILIINAIMQNKRLSANRIKQMRERLFMRVIVNILKIAAGLVPHLPYLLQEQIPFYFTKRGINNLVKQGYLVSQPVFNASCGSNVRYDITDKGMALLNKLEPNAFNEATHLDDYF